MSVLLSEVFDTLVRMYVSFPLKTTCLNIVILDHYFFNMVLIVILKNLEDSM